MERYLSILVISLLFSCNNSEKLPETNIPKIEKEALVLVKIHINTILKQNME